MSSHSVQPNVVETHGLSFSFSPKAKILQDLSLAVPAGSIYGFLGPNGAGKTTTLRLVLGLLKNGTQSIRVFGEDLVSSRLSILQRTGSLIEQPSLYLHLTARENLRVFGIPYGVTRQRMDEVLSQVDLTDVANKKSRAFSLGMKQRLAIGIALLHDPQLLVLDEPTNGLDPAGIIEVRDLVKRLNRELSKTILISSHLLGEVEKFATHVGIIHLGKMLFQGTLGDLQKMKASHSLIEVETDDPEKVKELIQDKWPVRIAPPHVLHVEVKDRESVAALNELLVQHGIKVYRIGSVRSDLEDLFMQVISE